jgi:rare lipoprotein A
MTPASPVSEYQETCVNTRGRPGGRPRIRAALLGLAGLLLAACAGPVAIAPPPLGYEETGLASWYGEPHHGRLTASGEVYDMHGLTAAHRTLPLGTRVLVSRLATGDAVEVRVNDRGPFVDGRILDLSYAAARILRAVDPGVIPVRLRVVALPEPTAAPGGGAFAVQVGAFSSRRSADRLRQTLGDQGFPALVEPALVAGSTVYRVRVGGYPDRGAAEAAAGRLAERGYSTLVVER